MKRISGFVFLALVALLLAACPLMNTGKPQAAAGSASSSGGGSSAASLSIENDTSRNQGVLVTGTGATIDITATADDGTTVSCAVAEGVATVADAPGSKSLSTTPAAISAIIVGTRGDGNPGVWAYSSNKIQGVMDEDSGQVTSRLPESADQNGVFRGQFGWVYHVMGISEDGKVIIGYAENKRGVNRGPFQIDPGTTIGVYWKITHHPLRPFFLASRAHIIGTYDLAKLHGAPRRFQHWINQVLRHCLDQLKLLLINYLSSYLVMVDKNGVHFDATNNVYLVTGTDQDDQPAVASIDPKGNITITETSSGSSGSIFVAGSYANGASTVACYWVDGVKTDLDTGGHYPAHATSISVSSGSVYIGGYYYNSSTGANVGCYWVNGTRTDLTGTSANVNSIFLSGGTLYSAGFYYPSQALACYWTGNGSPTSLSSVAASIGNSIYVSGSTIYVAGRDNILTVSNACYWAGGSQVNLSHSGASGANSIFVSGGTPYIAGQDTVSGTAVAAYWAGNTAPVDLSGGNGASANSIFVSGGTLYTAGQYGINTTPVACYWVGGTKQDLPGASADAQSIYVSGGTIYTAGYYGSAPTVACYWAGTTKTDLPGNNGQALSIFVQ